MKRCLLVLLGLALSTIVSANDKGYGTRYNTTYERWDREFTTYYDYSETRIVTDVRCDLYTCYEFQRTERVYIEEVIIESGEYAGYQRVRVYNSGRYQDPYATYYVHDRRIVHREFHHHRHVTTYYTHTDYVYVNFYALDEATQLLIVGLELFELGLDVGMHCRNDNDDLCETLALASMVSASAVSISASNEAEKQRQTELQAKIEAAERASKGQSLKLK